MCATESLSRIAKIAVLATGQEEIGGKARGWSEAEADYGAEVFYGAEKGVVVAAVEVAVEAAVDAEEEVFVVVNQRDASDRKSVV